MPFGKKHWFRKRAKAALGYRQMTEPWVQSNSAFFFAFIKSYQAPYQKEKKNNVLISDLVKRVTYTKRVTYFDLGKKSPVWICMENW